MKLAILTQYYPPEVGAPQGRLSELAAHFVRRGHEVVVLTAMPNYPTGRIQQGYGGLFQREQAAGAEILRTFIFPTQKADFIHRLTNYFSFVLSSSLYGSFALKQADYLLVESPPLFLGLAGFWLSRLKRAKLIFNVSDLWPESAASMGVLDRHSAVFRLSEKLEEFCYRHAWLITGQSQTIVADIVRRYPQLRTLLLSNGVDTERFRPNRFDEESRAELSSNGDFVVVYAGLHGLAQGLHQVLEAAALLKGEKGFRFVMVGDGPQKQTLLERANRHGLANVRFFDPRPAEDMPKLLASSDAVLVTLKTHIPGAVPSKLYEAMATGRPVILVAEGEAVEIVRNYEAGITVAPGDVNGLVQALCELRSSPALRCTLGKNGRCAAKAHFDRKTIASRFIEYLEAHLKSSYLSVQAPPANFGRT
jgi:glycosyltransferase involved in cell wall biosynthesis